MEDLLGIGGCRPKRTPSCIAAVFKISPAEDLRSALLYFWIVAERVFKVNSSTVDLYYFLLSVESLKTLSNAIKSIFKHVTKSKREEVKCVGKKQKTEKSTSTKKLRPASTPEARENQLICLAYDRAEEQLLDGTASSQVITHFLKLGCAKAKIEEEKLRQETMLVEAKIENLKTASNIESLYSEAIDAMKRYSGNDY